jgi:hypothetical protein
VSGKGERPWLVRPVTVGTAADTPFSLRRKAAEFRRLANEAAAPEVKAELTRLAVAYLERAAALEREPEPGPTPRSSKGSSRPK